jgi:hypothetical protein
MNAKGLPFILEGVITGLEAPGGGYPSFYQKLVSAGTLSQGELDGTRNNLKGLVATLKKTPEDKIEAVVARYDKDLSAYADKFNALREASIEQFRIAQIMAGLAVTIMAKARIRG